MVDINGTKYNLCLLDTNAVSEIIKNRNEEFKKYLDKLFPEKYIPCFSVFTIAELQQRQDLFSKFMDLFTFFPSGTVKGHGEVIKEEIENYPNYKKIFPLSMSLVGLKPYKDLTRRETVELLFNSEPYTKYRIQHLAQRQQVLFDIESNIKSFFDERGKYTETEMWIYLHWYVLQEIYMRNTKFAEIRRKNNIKIDIKAFPTILMMAYVTFYKFQEDQNRKPEESDIFDIAISSIVPYMDAFITERHQAEVIKKIKGREKGFLQNIRILTLKDLREL